MSLRRSSKKKIIYLDHAAATPLDIKVLHEMRPFFITQFANPSALYDAAVQVRKAVESARSSVANLLGTQPDSVIFTGGGTESCNLAIFGICRNKDVKIKIKKHIVTTRVEHHAVLHSIQQLEKEGFDVTYLKVNSEGQIDLEEFKKTLRPETVLVSIQYANNEIGTIYPIAEIGREILKWRKKKSTVYPYLHTDACQAAGYLDLHVDRLHVDFMSFNGSKIYGPKGVGVLYKRRGVNIEPVTFGGGHEFGLRPGTENVAGIVGFGKALELVITNREKETKRVALVRDYFWENLQKKIAGVALNGSSVRLPNNLNVTFTGVDAEALILYLDARGVMCSSGSACTTDSNEVSHVLLACGSTEVEAKSSIRFTLGMSTTKKDIAYIMKFLPATVEKLRRMT